MKTASKLQERVDGWMQVCFGPEISCDRTERNHRFLEEALELVQSLGCTASEAHQLVDYVFGRPIGDPHQESGGVSVTHAALCNAAGIDLDEAAYAEVARIWTKVEKIRAKQAAKPRHSPLPEVAGFNVVAIDNLNRDYNGGRSEWIIAGGIRGEDQAKVLAKAWNSAFCTEGAQDFAVVRSADRPIYVFEGY